MRRVPISKVKQGMKVAKCIYSANGTILVRPGVGLSGVMVKRLKQLGFPAIYVDDGLLSDIEIDDVITEQTRVKANTLVHEVMSSRINKLPDNKGEQFKDVITKMIQDIMDNPFSMAQLTDINTIDNYTFNHSVNVCILSLLTGKELGLRRDQLMELGMGAMLHDVGKVVVPIHILNKPGRLTEEEFREVQKHPSDGCSIISSLKGIGDGASQVVLEHHERYDGSGYPRGSSEDKISVYSKIAAVADVFDAVTSDRVYRKSMQPDKGLGIIMNGAGSQFDFKVIQSFYKRVAVYPSGSYIRLSNGEIAGVVETPKGLPLNPTVRVLYTAEEGTLRQPFERRLAEELTITVKELVPDHEVEKLIATSKSYNNGSGLIKTINDKGN